MLKKNKLKHKHVGESNYNKENELIKNNKRVYKQIKIIKKH